MTTPDHTVTHPEAAYIVYELVEQIESRQEELQPTTDDPEPLDPRLVEPLARLAAARACLLGHALVFGVDSTGSQLPPEGLTRGNRTAFEVIGCRCAPGSVAGA